MSSREIHFWLMTVVNEAAGLSEEARNLHLMIYEKLRILQEFSAHFNQSTIKAPNLLTYNILTANGSIRTVNYN